MQVDVWLSGGYLCTGGELMYVMLVHVFECSWLGQCHRYLCIMLQTGATCRTIPI